jgi:surface antigen
VTPKVCILRGLLVAALALATPAMASNLSFMKDTPYTHFTKDDHKIFNAALNEVLEKAADGEARSWSNPDSKAGGELKGVKTFERKGAPCRRVSIANKAKGRSASGEYNFCKQASGKWTLAN